jgi:hypothetical protein
MQCPSCKSEVDSEVWFCPICAEQLRAPKAADPTSEAPAFNWDDPLGDQTFVDEVSETIAWSVTPDFSQEALIVGSSFEPAEPGAPSVQTFDGAVLKEDGTTSSFLLYADPKTAGLVKPEAVPVRSSAPPGDFLTPYESFVYGQIDGKRTIGEIQADGLLAPAEVNVSILTLLDRGSIAIPERPPTRGESPAPPSLDPGLLVELPEETPKPLPPPVAPPPPAGRTESVPPRPMATVVVTRRRVTDAPPPLETKEAGRPAVKRPAAPIGGKGIHTDKAKELHAAAMKDRAQGNLVSARMNLKLAIAFDPHNEKYQEAFSQLANLSSPTEPGPRVVHNAAQKLYEDACIAETAGDIDKAIKLLETGLRHGEDPILLNRLGVVVATKKRQFLRAQELLQRAIELAPQNPVYTHNLSKILGLAASRDVERAASSPGREPQTKKRGSFWQRLFGR